MSNNKTTNHIVDDLLDLLESAQQEGKALSVDEVCRSIRKS